MQSSESQTELKQNHMTPSPWKARTSPETYREKTLRDSESLDIYIQNTLSSLYPPFEATAATVLWQLFSIVEKLYRGDGLRCLIDFLVPAKRALQCIQQETCAKYTGLIFYHEGWPLCIHEKVVVQLASVHKVRLKPGDFYFQIISAGKQSVKLVLKCLSRHGRGIEEITVPETMYGWIFTAEFLENVNCERENFPLQSCLLTAGPAVYRTPWENIVNPIFVPTTETILHNYSSNPLLKQLISSKTDVKTMTQTMESNSSRDSSTSNDTGSTVIEAPFFDPHGNQGSGVSSSVHAPESRIELESPQAPTEESKEDYINVGVFSKDCPSITNMALPQSIKPAEMTERLADEALSPRMEKKNSAKSIAFCTDLSSPCPRRQQLRDSLYFETRRLFRKSYIEALQNPMNLGSSSEESIAEEDTTHQLMDSSEVRDEMRFSESKTSEKQFKKESSLSDRLTSEEETREIISPDCSQASKKVLIPHETLPVADCRAGPRRSRSLDRSHKSSHSKEQRPRVFSDDSAGGNPKKLLNGHALRLGKLDSDGQLFAGMKSHKCHKEDEDYPHNSAVTDAKSSFQGDECNTTTDASPMLFHCESELLSTSAGDICHKLPNQSLDINQELLQSGVLSLCGSRDRGGRAVVQVCTRHPIWLSEHSITTKLASLLMYFYSIPRKEVRDLGLVILVDTRKCQPIPSLFKAFATVQNVVPHSIHNVLILTDKESAFKPDKDATIQYEVFTSLKTLHKLIDSTQLTAEFDGTFMYNHNDWLRFRRKLEPFITNCKEAIVFLQNSVCSLSINRTLSTVQEVNDLINKHKTMMKLVLEDVLLVTLRLEGGTILARLRKEEFCNTEDYRDAMESITRLYNQVDEEVHRLVLLSNKCFQQLENLREVRKFEEGCDQIKLWFENERERYLSPLEQDGLSLENVKKQQEEFQVYSDKAMQYYGKGLQLVQEHCSLNLEEKVQAFKRYLSNISTETEKRRNELEKLVTLYEFYETAQGWMSHCNEYLECITAKTKYSQSEVQCLQSCYQEAKKVSSENFKKVNELVLGLGSKKELKQWNILWLKCQQTRHHLEEVLSEALKSSSKESSCRVPKEAGIKINYEPSQSSSHLSSSSDDSIWDFNAKPPHNPPQASLPSGVPSLLLHKHANQNMDVSVQFSASPPQTLAKLFSEPQRTSPNLEDTDSISTSGSASCYSEPIQSPVICHRRHPLKKIMKKTQSFDFTQHESSHSELHRHGYTGVYIKGLEVASNIAAEKKYMQRLNIKSPLISRNRSLSSPSRIHHTEEEDKKRAGSKVQHIMDEMITTEREYVRSLGYIIDNYFPEMERIDLPQDLRGKRNIIFGNLEKLYDFHCQYFLKELEHCRDLPLRVSHCFLRHEEQFGMYALYSKNKPQSDTLLTSHGNAFFKNKQQDLGDKMDLASYLLKPIQRMSKYALLLKDMIKECTKTQEQELSDLRSAEIMVKFQLRHGNDLLAMDAIRGCDVNLKEQGQLRCQDEFIVCCGRKKYLRHVFLFDDLILFSKTKKIDGGYDIYMYKQSFKTAEIGMTENVGESGLRFEIWFRRRRKTQDTYILQANSAEVKVAWTSIIGKILWRQALRNRELRMQEMVSMGIGNKPFMDIKPSEAAISDRAIDYIMKGTESRSRASIAVSSFDHSTPFKRPHSTISNSSTSSSSSQSSSSILGSLNLHVYTSPSPPSLLGPPFYHWSYDIRTCIEEDELEQETGSQPSMITESSESSQCTSGESVSGFSSSAHFGLSQLPTETFLDEGASNTDSKPPSQCTSPTLPEKNPRSKHSSPYVTDNKTSHVLGLSTMV
ncbi:pleckstrin homology domain-containing family G member 4B isoform X2 [Alligator mississippiensis]|uniref:pleckstrin homology domain-containing family G member 4B isoform X2 n=1 Tax=Alligator mississippiensis TaxID=8496 RepID=UPI000907186A|nr:pleckstrin homology domain-containing family G member 4B isoform X2 [Alligator mississippiensis]